MDADPTAEVNVTETPPPVEESQPAPEVVVEGNTPDETWSPPQFAEENGIAIDGDGLPVNHRLRAEALVDAGKDEDPGGMISPELIENTRERLEGEREARPPVYSNMKVADLERIAMREDIDISGAANNDERVRLIRTARGEEVS